MPGLLHLRPVASIFIGRVLRDTAATGGPEPCVTGRAAPIEGRVAGTMTDSRTPQAQPGVGSIGKDQSRAVNPYRDHSTACNAELIALTDIPR